MTGLTVPPWDTPISDPDRPEYFSKIWWLTFVTFRRFIQGGGSAQIAYANGALALTNVVADIPGATLTLLRAGTYLIHGVFDFQVAGADLSPNALVGQLSADGTLQSNDALFAAGIAGNRGTVGQQWIYSPAAAGKIVKLRALKTGGGGASTCNAVHTSISALWIGA